MRVLVVGLDSAGKSTLVSRLKGGGEDEEVAPTVGFEIETVEMEGFRVTLWDVGGQRSLRAYWRNYFEETDGVVWVVDAADQSRLEEAALELAHLCAAERLAMASLVVVANKQDVQGALGPEELTKLLHLQGLERGFHVAPCSARSGEGVHQAFHWLVNDIASRIYVC